MLHCKKPCCIAKNHVALQYAVLQHAVLQHIAAQHAVLQHAATQYAVLQHVAAQYAATQHVAVQQRVSLFYRRLPKLFFTFFLWHVEPENVGLDTSCPPMAFSFSVLL